MAWHVLLLKTTVAGDGTRLASVALRVKCATGTAAEIDASHTPDVPGEQHDRAAELDADEQLARTMHSPCFGLVGVVLQYRRNELVSVLRPIMIPELLS